jgi:hypothetical protein
LFGEYGPPGRIGPVRVWIELSFHMYVILGSSGVDQICHHPAVASRLVAQYFQLVEPWDLDIPPPAVLKDPQVQAAIYEQMFDESRIDPIPPLNYRTRVLKTVIARIEESLTDPEEDVCISEI